MDCFSLSYLKSWNVFEQIQMIGHILFPVTNRYGFDINVFREPIRLCPSVKGNWYSITGSRCIEIVPKIRIGNVVRKFLKYFIHFFFFFCITFIKIKYHILSVYYFLFSSWIIKYKIFLTSFKSVKNSTN